ncbi:MAG: aminopeptidase P family protein [Hyphomicrobiales bacterium]|nr:aminopeptidase P family protein [Hyphomicrobiales bacterium]
MAALRAELRVRGLSGFLIPSTDEFQSEMAPPCDERLLWLTGFSGSWGLAIVLDDAAALFVDGRYTLQAAKQVDAALFEVVKYPDVKPADWLRAKAAQGATVGYDARLHSVTEVKVYRKAAEAAGAAFTPVDANPVDAIWTDRPAQPASIIASHPLRVAGVTAADKLAALRETLCADKQHAVALASPQSIAWALNIRAGDLAHTPVALGYALIYEPGGADIFISPERLSPEAAAELDGVARFRPAHELSDALAALAGKIVRLDPERASAWLDDRLRTAGAVVSAAPDPCLGPRARKNPVEIAGARAAHERDGAALVRFLHWLDTQPAGAIDEIGAAQRLEALRRDAGARDISFATIAGAGPNGAVVHYRPTRSTNRALEAGTLFLIDSGGQYEDGTTDVTRTVAVGAPTPDMRRQFTLVLKGHIALAEARFPAGTKGVELDSFARAALWRAGLDYDHGTGHGVGSYLSVHEGPASIGKRGSAVIEPGMILSNEPGYYRTGQYGIRIENLMLALPPEHVPGGDRPMMAFETLTLAPIDASLIDATLLTEAETRWINAYHERVFEALASHLPADVAAWLRAATQPLPGAQA